MFFWFFMMAMNLMIPTVMIFFGRFFMRSVPKTINHFFGYRTTMSMKNRDTWEFAHRHFGHLWLKTGTALLIPTVLAMVPVWGKSTDAVAQWGCLLCLVECLVLMVPIAVTEKALKRTFDAEGRRRSTEEKS